MRCRRCDRFTRPERLMDRTRMLDSALTRALTNRPQFCEYLDESIACRGTTGLRPGFAGGGGRHATGSRNRDFMPAIALVDDDRNILTSVSIALEAEGYRITTYTD